MQGSGGKIRVISRQPGVIYHSVRRNRSCHYFYLFPVMHQILTLLTPLTSASMPMFAACDKELASESRNWQGSGRAHSCVGYIEGGE